MKKLFNYRYILFVLLTVLIVQKVAMAQEEPVDYSSPVPHYTFSTTLEEQQAELQTNPLLQRFNESRASMANDPHRPIYHYVNPEGRLNDPNGLCFWQGNWHLFYQAYPPEDSRQHWGHTISKDLIHWEDLPLAIYPDPERACYSGSALVDGDQVVAFYHGTEVGSMAAVSSDPLLLNWEKVTGKAVIPEVHPSGFPLPYSVYDPCIWKRDGIYYALLGGRVNEGPANKPVPTAYLFRSSDLANWQYMHEFVEDDRFTLIGDDYACPYFWPIGDRYIMPFYSHMSGGQYLLGDYDTERNKFVTTNHGNFNFGPSGPSGVHAPSAAPDGDDGVIIIFNMNPGMATKGWNQIMSLPRRLTLISEDEIGIEPAGDIESLRYNHKKVEAMTLPANKEIKLKSIKGNAMEIYAEIDPKKASMIELNVLQSSKKEEYTTISILPQRGYRSGRNYWRVPGEQQIRKPVPALVSLLTAHSSTMPDTWSRAPETAPVPLEKDETIKLRIFIDKSVVEVFVNGKQCVAARVYPGMDNSVGVSILSQGSESELLKLDAWQMKNIYE
jgi:beta-fructofuranosidase